MKRNVWQRPRLVQLTELAHHRKVSWLELFFDLFFVVAIAAVAHSLAQNLSLYGLKEFVICFIAIWWIWIGTTYYNERFETFGLENRVFTFLLMLPIAGMAIFAHHAMSDNFVGFVSCYVIARGIVIFLWIRVAVHIREVAKLARLFLIGYGLSLAVALLSIFLPASVQISAFVVALGIDLLTPILGSYLVGYFNQESIEYSEKVSERFGLFTIIVLAEILVGTINGITQYDAISAELLIIGGLGILLGFCFWWVYFDFVNRPGLPNHPVHGYLWSYGHLPFVMGLVITGAALLFAIAEGGGTDVHFQHFVGGAVGLSLVMLAFLEYFSKTLDNEPTHPMISPLLKLLTGFLALGVGWTHLGLRIMDILIVLILLLMINMAYGAYVWFNQDLEEILPEDYRS